MKGVRCELGYKISKTITEDTCFIKTNNKKNKKKAI